MSSCSFCDWITLYFDLNTEMANRVGKKELWSPPPKKKNLFTWCYVNKQKSVTSKKERVMVSVLDHHQHQWHPVSWVGNDRNDPSRKETIVPHWYHQGRVFSDKKSIHFLLVEVSFLGYHLCEFWKSAECCKTSVEAEWPASSVWPVSCSLTLPYLPITET